MCEPTSETRPNSPAKTSPDNPFRSCVPRPVVPLKPIGGVKVFANIVEFSVTTDSVVATVTIRTDTVMRRIRVEWGDGAATNVVAQPGVPTLPNQPLPPGTYRIHHAYAEPEDRRAFERLVFVRVEDNTGPDFRVQLIRVTPRYRVTNFRTSVALDSQCDSIFESSNEFDITQFVDGTPVRQWRWEPSNNIIPEPLFRLEGSIVSRELTMDDAQVNVLLELIERDPVFDDRVALFQSLHASMQSERFQQVVSGDGCRVLAQWDRDVRLLVPLPPSDTTLETAQV